MVGCGWSLIDLDGCVYYCTMEMGEIQCPTCFEWFEIALPGLAVGEIVELDYDCEICCRPMLVIVDENAVRAQSLSDL